MSNKWVKEAEHSSEEIQIHTHSLTIQCQIFRNTVDVLYNPTVREKLLSASFARTKLGDEPHALSGKFIRIAPRSILIGLGILHNLKICHGNVKMALDFHVFDIQDFDVMKGCPLEKFLEPPTSGELDIKLGSGIFPFLSLKLKTQWKIFPPYPKLPKEVLPAFPFKSPESYFKKRCQNLRKQRG